MSAVAPSPIQAAVVGNFVGASEVVAGLLIRVACTGISAPKACAAREPIRGIGRPGIGPAN